MGVKDYPSYIVTEHAKERIYSRFNITKNEFDAWVSRLMSQSTFVENKDGFMKKYRLNDVVLIVDSKQKKLVTVYSQNEYDDTEIHEHTNPEVKSAINAALRDMIKRRKVKTAVKIHDNLQAVLDACDRMVNPYTNFRFTDRNWDELITNFMEVKKAVETGMNVIEEAEKKIQEG